MDHTSWLWRRKPLDKSPGESESTGSVSSHSGRYSDDQEALRPVSKNSSPHHGQSPDISSRINDNEIETQDIEAAKSLNKKLALAVTVNGSSPQHGQSMDPVISSNVRDNEILETVKNLSEKLSAALLTISAKEDLVKQHAKVAEEAVAGWEQAELEVTALKRLLEDATEKNASLEDQVRHLDNALKECVRQLRQSREEQEEKICDAVVEKSRELESQKTELQNHIAELKKQQEATKLEATATSVQHGLQEKLQAVERENKDLKAMLLARSKDLEILSLERDLSNQAAETASKQHLESVKKIARAEAECRRLRHLTRRTSLANDSRPVANNACMESLTDSHSDGGEKMLTVDNEMRNSDLWASALIAELDQFKNGKAGERNLVNNSVEIDLMDDFLEMEKLAALPVVNHTNSSFELETDSDQAVTRDNLRAETEALRHQVVDLQAKVEKIESEKSELEMALVEARNQLDISCDALVAAKNRLIELQMQLDFASKSRHAALGDVERLDAERKTLELQLESKSVEVEELHAVVASLEENAERKELESQLELILAEAAELRLTVTSLEERIEAERALSVQHKENAEAAGIAKEALEAQLCSANSEAEKLHAMAKALESEAQQEKALREELTAQVEAVKIEAKRILSAEAVKESLEAQLQVANAEVAKLHGMVNVLECKAEKEKAFSAELSTQLEAVEAIRKVLASEVESAHQETGKLMEKVESLEVKLKEQTTSAAEFAAKSEAVHSERKAMEGQLEAANMQVTKLTNKVNLLQGKIEQEKLLSEDYKVKCQKLEAQLSRDSREAKLWRLANSNGDLKVKQEKELANAAGKLAECQKTIASLGRQLKLLTDLDGVISEPEKLVETRDMVLDFRNGDDELLSADFTDGLYDFDLPNGNGSCFSPLPSLPSSPPPSEMSVFAGGLSSLSSYRSKTRK